MSRPLLLALQILVAIVAIAIWHVFSKYPICGLSYLGAEKDCATLLPPFFFSSPGDVAARIFKWFADGTIWKHLWITLVEAMLAFVIGSLGGVLIGFWFARKPTINAVFDPYVKMLNALPRVVLAPIFALWFGLGIASKVALGFTLVFFIVFFNVYQGVKEVSPTVLANRSEERRVGKECRCGGVRCDSSRRRHTRYIGDWSSDVCSSALVRPLCEDAQCAAAGRAGADLRALVRTRHRLEGLARLHAGILHRVLQRLSGPEGSQPHGAGQ